MKNNKIMRCASALLVVALLSTCAISGTFAKYVTSTTGGDNARVAYWGFDQPSTIELDLFDAEYDGTVKSQNGDNVVAPGASKSTAVAFHYKDNTGKNITAPEVDYKFTVDVETYGSTIDLDSNKSFKWTLERYEGLVEEYNTLDELVNAVERLSGAASGTTSYEAGTLPSEFNHNDDNSIKIGWKWDYNPIGELTGEEIYDTTSDTYIEVREELTTDQVANRNQNDTVMGLAETLDNVNIKITITAEQVD